MKKLAEIWRETVIGGQALGDASNVEVVNYYTDLGYEVEIFTGDDGLKAFEPTSESKHSIASEVFCMNQVTFALQNIKIRLWQAVKILKEYWNFTTRSQKQVVYR